MVFNKNVWSRIAFIGVTIFIALVIFVGGYYMGQGKIGLSFLDRPLAFSPASINVSNLKSTSSAFNFNLYWQVWDSLKTRYVDKNKINDQDLFYGSLKGMAQATGDPYTVFMSPKEAKEFSDELAGTFEGIGAELGIRNDIITVIAPLDGMPAQKAGLRSGDKIYAVDGQAIIGLSLGEVVRKIRGPRDTKVRLTIIRGKEKPQDITITRSVIVVKSVKTTMRPDGILVIRVSSFNNDTQGLFDQAVNLALTKNPKGIILDLRNNPGGYLETAVNMASEWIAEGPIVAEEFNNNRRNEYSARGNARLQNIPTVVLVNGGSASASEILAGALRDYKKAILVGEQTFGKGSVQTISSLANGASLKITVAKWLTPAGDYIHDKGIKPNIIIPLTIDDINKNKDPQFDKALDILLKKAKK